MAGGSLGLASSSASGSEFNKCQTTSYIFKKVFKRHTNFELNQYNNLKFQVPANFGNSI